eukprot:c32287_g1_i1.p1 GENE.c32287_g1_i1~~c32287_g1_i1.p1  ORF type:complete len:490 (+),score=93.63 c32287_g1_i1:35-1471(+)
MASSDVTARLITEMRSSMSSIDLRRVIDEASTEFERRKRMGMPHGDDPDLHLSLLLKDSLNLMGRNFLFVLNMRAGFAFLLRFLQLLQKKPRALASFNALFSEDSIKYRVDAVRFGLFIGGLTGGFKLIRGLINRWRGRDDEYSTILAGMIASLSFFFVDKSRRRMIALYTFARCAQGLYNASKARGQFHFWGSHWEHGDTLLFALSSACIMYAYAMRPEALPQSFFKFIVQTGPIDIRVLNALRLNNRSQPISLTDLTTFVQSKSKDVVGSLALQSTIPPCIPCSVMHPQNVFCTKQVFDTFVSAFTKTFPLYLSLTLVPAVVLKFSRFVRSPLTGTSHAIAYAIRSTAFMGTFNAVYMAVVCTHRNLFTQDHRSLYWIAGFISSWALLIERKSRRAELALYTMPRAADLLFYIMKDRRWLSGVPFGEEMLFVWSMGILMYFHHHEQQCVSPLFTKVMNVFLMAPHKPMEHDTHELK